MNEARAPTEEEVKGRIKSDYLNGVKPKALSEKYGVSINTIKSWIKRYRWGKEDKKESAPKTEGGAPPKKKKGAPFGNKNAAGAGAPKGNINALKHGANAKFLMDSLDEEEIQYMQNAVIEEGRSLKREIALFDIREQRLMRQIKDFKEKTEKGLYVKGAKKSTKLTYDEDGNQCGKVEETSTDTEYALKGILALESELTKLQRARNKSIDSLIRLRVANERYDDMLNGWKSKAESLAAEGTNSGEDEESGSVMIYLPDNERGGT